MRRYNPKEIEPKWQKVWAESGVYKTDMKRTDDKFYIIPMLPYPSGDLHIGHWYNFAPTDTVARFRRMLGNNVMTTIGFDAFGLPAENAAIKRGIQPAVWTHSNIKSMTQQIGQIGASYDWDHSLATCDPNYYRWNQWLFLKLYEKGLAYRAKAVVNWCPKDQTVLANEQVVGDDNVCERCGTPVVQKEMESWYFKITEYADRLLDDLEAVDWPQKVKVMQENWIGRSRGLEIDFTVVQRSPQRPSAVAQWLTVFTTRADTLAGATFIAVAPEHSWASDLAEKDRAAEVDKYIYETQSKTELERKQSKNKKGVFTGAFAINPLTKVEIPIYVADYVLGRYGTGAVMGVPAHDERDREFAKQNNVKIKAVILPDSIPEMYNNLRFAAQVGLTPPQRLEVLKQEILDGKVCYPYEGVMIESGKYSGMRSEEFREVVSKAIEESNQGAKVKLPRAKINHKISDWLISRQRYWGTPIPIVYCDKCGTVPVPEADLPVILPEDVEFELSGQSPLMHREDFVNAKCPKCGGPAKRETDTMDTFVCSSWYFLRYLDNKNDTAPFDTELINKWMPMDHYIGGIEHAILHLLYARFVTKFLHDHHGLGFEEPFKKLTNQGIILGPDGQKMSKSKGNVVNPDEQVTSYGADSLRLYLMFMGPYDQGGPYSMGGIAGTRRFLERYWALAEEYLEAPAGQNNPSDLEVTAAVHKTVKKVTQDLEKLNFNTALAAQMSLINELYRLKTKEPITKSKGWTFAVQTMTQLLAPLAPHITEQVWENLGHDSSVHVSAWPVWDEKLVAEEVLTIGVQVNGKVRSEIVVAADVSQADAIAAAKADAKIIPHIKGKAIKKEIYVPGRLVSLVV